MKPTKNQLPKKERVNDQIRISPVQVISEYNSNLGTMPTEQAKELARAAWLDLVEINPNSKPPLCQIMDYGKYRFEQSKRAQASKKKHADKLKEIRLTPRTGEHDLAVKSNKIRTFLLDGHKVQISVQFKGREIMHEDIGYAQLDTILATLGPLAKVEAKSRQGKRIIMMLSPDKQEITKIRRQTNTESS